ncbi:MAG: phosphoglycerate mutase (2,3-diphosphoglycerate-independent) [Deltaproteobacteria bacterium]|nr:MAG: phosphoglycerate mutase (2,3-diphosphoglycerate-independent) [Deltaproteobacteria bacterium]
MTENAPVMLMILDGWGIGEANDRNAVHVSGTPFLKSLEASCPHTALTCAGPDVGLPEGIMGNSEVGHLNIGAGRTVYQDLLRIDNAIADGSFYTNPQLTALMQTIRKKGTTLHLMGLLSDGGVHSQLTHLEALIRMAGREGCGTVAIHAIMDGRDTAPNSGLGYMTRLEKFLADQPHASVASVSGRFYAMDRDTRWERTERAYTLYTQPGGPVQPDPVHAVREAYAAGETDEFIQPVRIAATKDVHAPLIADDDAILFFNFRADRARQITRAFTDPAFDEFERPYRPALSAFVCMTFYDKTFDLPIAFPPVRPTQILGQVVSDAGRTQLRIAETEKYAHVTYFFNGGEETPFPGEDRVLVPSPRTVPTYDLIPEMSAETVTHEVLERLESPAYDLIVLNFANMDMVGHTGVMDAAVKACSVVDACVEKIVTRMRALGGITVITADHGNSELMADPSGTPHTAHTLNPVPLILVSDRHAKCRLNKGALRDIAPTVLALMGLEKPAEMTGTSLIAG